MANTKWNTFAALTAATLDDADLLPVSDDSQPDGSKDATISVAELRDALGGGGGGPISINAQTGTTYTLVIGDADKLVTLTHGSPITLTVPTNASVAFPTGTVVALAQLGAGLVSIAGDTGVTINGTTPGDEDSAGQWASFALTKLDTNTWLLTGGIA